MIDVRERDRIRDADSSLILLLEHNIWWLLIDSNSEPFQFRLNDLLVSKGLIDIKNNKNQMTSLRNSNHLSTSTLSVLSTLNNTRQIQHLNLRPIVLHLSRNRCQSREFVCCSLGMLSCEPTHESAFPYRGKPNKSHTGNTSSCDVESRSTTTTTRCWCEEL